METETLILWGASDSYKIHPNIYPNLLSLFFQDSQQGSGQADSNSEKVPLGWMNRSKENNMGQMGHSLSPKRKGWTGSKRYQDVQ